MSGGRPCGTPGMCPPEYYGAGANGSYPNYNPPPSSYVVNSKIMVVAVAVLFAVVVFILCLHVYAKWFWRNQGALATENQGVTGSSWRRLRRRGDPRVQNPSAGQVVVQSVGLERAVIEALPTFEFDWKATKGGSLECAVCLEEFECGEKGRTLPKCGHHFHLECVDMWLHSHSTCPLCRASVQPDEKGAEATIAVAIPEQRPEAQAPVIGDVQAPFMAAMRASRRRQRSRGLSQLPSLNSPTGAARATSDLIENPVSDSATESLPQPQQMSQEAPASAVDSKALAREYETPGEIPSNVLFWGNQSQTSVSAGGAQPSASSIRAPFQVTIDIPRLGQSPAVPLNPANLMSPMARASASFRRLLSRGKSVVSPHDDAPDEGGPSSSPRPPTPPPPSAS